MVNYTFALPVLLSQICCSVTPSSPSVPPDLLRGPKHYHNLCDVFSKENSLFLPPHWQYDCDTEMLTGASPAPFGCITCRVLIWRQWISTSACLAAGIIQLSSSLLRWGSFLWRRKTNPSIHVWWYWEPWDTGDQISIGGVAIHHMNLAYIQSAKRVVPDLFITADRSTHDNFTAAQGGSSTVRSVWFSEPPMWCVFKHPFKIAYRYAIKTFWEISHKVFQNKWSFRLS